MTAIAPRERRTDLDPRVAILARQPLGPTVARPADLARPGHTTLAHSPTRQNRDHDRRPGPTKSDRSVKRLPSLLIADDDPVVRSILAAQLSRSFDVVAGAKDADEAIEFAVMHLPDIAIIDVQMPGGGGLRATRELHERTPGTAIVALSVDESDATVRHIMAAGAVTYLSKGIPGKDLVVTLHRSIAAHAQRGGPTPKAAAV